MMTGFTVLGVFIVGLLCAFIFVLVCGALAEWSISGDFGYGCVFGMGFLIVILIFALASTGVSFTQNPEHWGYTRIEQEVEE